MGSQHSVQKEVDSRVEHDEAVRDIVDVHEPGGIHLGRVHHLVDGGDEAPHVAEEKEPHDPQAVSYTHLTLPTTPYV